MSNINSQASLDGLILSGTTVIIENNTTDIVVTDDITLSPGHTLSTDSLGSTVSSNLICDGAIVNFTEASGGFDWQRGDFSLEGGALVFSKAPDNTPPNNSDNCQWPGFQVNDQNFRPTYNMKNARIYSYNGAPVTNHYGNMAETGNDFEGLQIFSGAFFYPFGAVALIGVTFSSDFALDARIIHPVLSGFGYAYTRPQIFTGSGTQPSITAKFGGHFGCTMTGWTDTNARAVSLGLTPSSIDSSVDGELFFFDIDNTYDTEYATNGVPYEAGGSGSQNIAPLNVVAGQSWNPIWRDASTLADVEDIVFDTGAVTTTWFCNNDGSNLTLPSSQGRTNSINYISYYNGVNRRTGYVLQSDQIRMTNSGTDGVSKRAQQPSGVITGIREWSYTHECYNNSGNSLTRSSTKGNFSDSMRLDAAFDSVDRNSEAYMLNGNDLAAATGWRTGRTLTSLDNLYAALKAHSYTDRETTRPYSVAGSALSMGSANWELFGGTTISSSIKSSVSANANLAGGDLFNELIGGDFSSLVAVTLSDMFLNCTTLNLTNITLGTGLTIGGTASNIPNTFTGVVFSGNPVFNLVDGQTYTFDDCSGAFILNLTNAGETATANIINGTSSPSTTGNGTIIIPEDLGKTLFQVGSALPSGRVILKERGSAAGVFIFDDSHTTGSTTALLETPNVSSNAVTYDLYYQPTNTFGTDGAFYVTNVLDGTNDADINVIIQPTSVEHADVLTTAAENADLTGLSAVLDASVSSTSAKIDITGTNSSTTAEQTQAILLRVVDDEHYLNLMANNGSLIDYLLPDINSETVVNTSALTLNTGETAQQSVRGVKSVGSGNLVATIDTQGPFGDIDSVIVIPGETGITSLDVQSATGKVLDDRLVTANNLENIGLGTPIVKDGALGTTFHNS